MKTACVLLGLTLAATPARASPADEAESQPASRDTREVEDSTRPGLARQIGIDFKNVFTTRENLWILGAGGAAALVAHPFDPAVPRSSFNAALFPESAFEETFESGQTLGGALFQAGAAVTTMAMGKAIGNPELAELGRDLVRAQVVTQGLTQAIKYGVSRARPDGSSQTSFPSGHSASSFATATVLQRHYGWKVGIPAYGFAGYVAASRLNANKHYLSDVVFGAAIGVLAGRTVTFELGDSRFALGPMVVSGGAGVQVSLVH